MQSSNKRQRRTSTVGITRRTRRAFVLGAAILLQACGSDAVDAPTGVPLSGSLVLQDTWGSNLLDYSGVEVSLDGLSVHAATNKDRSMAHREGAGWSLRRHARESHVRDDAYSRPARCRCIERRAKDHHGGHADRPGDRRQHSHFYARRNGVLLRGRTLLGPAAGERESHHRHRFPVGQERRRITPDPTTYDQWNASFNLSGGSSEFTMVLPTEGTRATFGAGTTLFVAGYATSLACSCYDDPITKKRVFSNTGPRGNVVHMTVK